MENMQNMPEGQRNYRNFDEHLKQPMSVGEWFITILVSAIPLIGLIMLFVWAFSGNSNINKANWAKATLIWMLIGIIFAGIIFGIVGVAALSNAFD